MKTGASTGGMVKSDARKRREARAKRAEEARWAAKNGPVITRQATPEELEALRAKRPE